MVVQIQITGADEIQKATLAIKRVPPRFESAFLDEAGKFGVKSVQLRVPVGSRPIGLNRDVVHARMSKHTEEVFFADPRNRVIAAYNEFGVTQHFRSIHRYPELKRWAMMKIPAFVSRGGNLLNIGGPNSYIKLGASKNKFIGRSVLDIANNVDVIANKAWKKIRK